MQLFFNSEGLVSIYERMPLVIGSAFPFFNK